jgi:hypothetical protein
MQFKLNYKLIVKFKNYIVGLVDYYYKEVNDDKNLLCINIILLLIVPVDVSLFVKVIYSFILYNNN